VSLGDQLIKCTLCTEEDSRLGRKELRDHIAARHLFYVRHKCESCDLKSLEATVLWEHFWETSHRVMFNRTPTNAEMESLLESIYSACLKSHAEDSQDKLSVPLIEIDDDDSDEADSDVEIIGVLPRPPPPPPTTTLKAGASAIAAKDKVASMSAPVAPAFASLEASLPRLPAVEGKVFRQTVPPAVEKKASRFSRPASPAIAKSKPTTKQQTCRMCGVVVQSMLPDNRKTHVANAHAKHSLKCPADGCNYKVTGPSSKAFNSLKNHSVKEHGKEPKKISSSAANRYREQKKVVKAELDRLVSQCFDTQD